jgi:ribosome biogenesis GTP-binding protein YsxC/EngB
MKVSAFSLVFQVAWFASIGNVSEGYSYSSPRVFSMDPIGKFKGSDIGPWYAVGKSPPWKHESSPDGCHKRKGRGAEPSFESNNPSNVQGDPQQVAKRPSSFGKRDIQGREILICRPFSVDSRKSFTAVGSYRSVEEIPTLSLPEVAFLGRSNVGKSSLINCLTGLNRKVVRTSKTPGRTQSINLLKCRDDKADVCVFTDLPGYGFANISKQKQAQISKFVQDYLLKRVALRLCVVLLDARRDPQESDYFTLKVSKK